MAALLLAGSSFAKSVNNVELSYKDGNTVAKINIEGTVRFTHQTEEAKDGRPYRVFVDLLKFEHNLGAQKFTELPDCPIKAIRTSQFSVEPEKVVRIVFDLDMERVYKVESDNNSVTVLFSDKDTKPYANWSTRAYIQARLQKQAPKSEQPVLVKADEKGSPKKTSVELNQTIDKDRILSLSDNNSTPSQEPAKTTVAKTVEKQAQKAEPKTNTQKESTEPKQAIVKKAEKKAVVAEVKKFNETKAVESKPKTNTVIESSDKAKQAENTQTTESANVAKKEDEKKITTSRFRRSADRSEKLKGTMVAEFPKRLVIKYNATNYRDPFETLIDETKTYNKLIERKVPNVEGLKLVGIIESGGQDNRALFEDTEGYGYILKTGDKVKKGYVLRVESKRVYFQIFEYGWSRTVALNLES